MIAGRLLALVLPLPAVVMPTAAADGQWARLGEPRAIVLFRRTSARGTGDPAGFVLS